ncbi:hypothetical protein P3L51_18610 [Streptomyces sp. PSRA5]|uniref:hypothetical protein n=1 Tax=Streptomyces panacea TaxID=3035064 RepID=UPI00339C0BC7
MRSGLLALRGAGLVATMVVVPVLGTTAADAHDSVKATVTPSTVRPGGEVKINVKGCENPRSVAARSDVFVADSELEGRDSLRGEAKIRSSTEDGRYKVDVWCDGHDHRGAVVFEVDHDPKPKPSTKASAKPKPKPSAKASAKPSAKAKPSVKASAKASPKPKPSAKPSTKASANPKPSDKPSVKASAEPEAKPKAKPSDEPEPEARPEAEAAPAPASKNPKPVHSQSSQASRTSRSSEPSHSAPASPVAPVRAGGGGRTTTDMAAEQAGPSTPHTVIGLVLAGVAAVAVAVRSARRKRSAARDSD